MHRGDPKRTENARMWVEEMYTHSKSRRKDCSRRRAGQSQVLHTSAHRKSVLWETDQSSKMLRSNSDAKSIMLSTTSGGRSWQLVVITVVLVELVWCHTSQQHVHNVPSRAINVVNAWRLALDTYSMPLLRYCRKSQKTFFYSWAERAT